MVECVPEAGEVAMALLGKNIPAIGPKLKTRAEAIKAVRWYMNAIDKMLKRSGVLPYKVVFVRQPDGRYTMVIKGAAMALETIPNLDELMVRRFQKSFKKGLFILTGFFEDNDNLECLALTEGLGVVLYSPQ